MAKEFAITFYRSSAWKKCRASFLLYKHGLCNRCDDVGVIVHHKTLLTQWNINDVDVTLNWDLLELLCLDCHNKEHGVGNSANVIREGLKFDSVGNVVKVDIPPYK